MLHLSISNHTRNSDVSMFSHAFKSLYMHMCSHKREACITKKQGVHTQLTTAWKRKKERQRRDETEQYESPSLLSQLALTFGRKGLSPLSRLIKERICSKQLYLNLSCLLLLQTQPPLQSNSVQTNSSDHAVYRSLCSGDMSTMNQKEEGHRSNGDKGH